MAHQFFFSPRILDNLPAPESGFNVVQDILEPRLRLYVTARGIKTFFTRKRVHGKDERIIIGRWPKISIEDARAEVLKKISIASRPVPIRRNGIMFDKLVQVYINQKIRRSAKGLKKLERAVARHWAPLMQTKVLSITTKDLEKIHEKIHKNTGVATANRMLEILNSVFKFACENGHIRENPVKGIKKIQNVIKKPKFGSREFARILSAIKKEKNPVLRCAFLMLVFGFARKSEIFAMRWRDLDFNNDTWLLRPLSDPAVVLLRNIPQSGPWVFPSHGRHLTDPRTAWKKLITSVGLPDVQMNDIYKYMIRQLNWTSDREQLRKNMNKVLTNIDVL
ncbi:MAG: hypothetical protein WC137_00765 [Alphaproteobacteria bacterium]